MRIVKEIFKTTPPSTKPEYNRRRIIQTFTETGSIFGASVTGVPATLSFIENGPLAAKITFGAATVIFVAGVTTMHGLRKRGEYRWKKQNSTS